MTTFRCDALGRDGEPLVSQTIEADASDAALVSMAERYPLAHRYEAVPLRTYRSVELGRTVTIPDDERQFNHEGEEREPSMWSYRRYLHAVREFLFLRARAGEKPSVTLGARSGAWAHALVDRLLEAASDPAYLRRETERLEEIVLRQRTESCQ